MTTTEIRATARQNVVSALMPVFLDLDSPTKIGDGEYAVRQEIDGQEVWTSIKVTVKAWKDTKVNKAFDAREAAEKYNEKNVKKA